MSDVIIPLIVAISIAAFASMVVVATFDFIDSHRLKKVLG